MNIEMETEGVKVSVNVPSAKTPDEQERVVKMAREVFRGLMAERAATPRPFGFSVWADTERRPSIEYAEEGRDADAE